MAESLHRIDRFAQVDARFDKIDARLDQSAFEETIKAAVEHVVGARFDRLESLLNRFLDIPGSLGGARA